MTPLCKYPQPLTLSGGRCRATCCPEHYWLRIARDRGGAWHVVADPEPAKGRAS